VNELKEGLDREFLIKGQFCLERQIAFIAKIQSIDKKWPQPLEKGVFF